MRHRWLALLSFATVGVVVFVFYWLRLQPITRNPATASGPVAGSLSSPTVTFVNPSRGPADAAVTIVEFGDFECEPCKDLLPAIDAVLRTYPNNVRFVWKNMPNESIHPLSTPAAIAAHCAGRQGKFWPYADELFARQVFLTEQQFTQIASDVGLDTDAFQTCYETREPLPTIKKDFDEGLALGIVATPTLFIGEERIVGSVTAEELATYVEHALAKP